MSRRYRNCIGPRVRELRMSKSLTQDQLAARLQLAGLHTLDRVGVAKIESQLRSVFDFETRDDRLRTGGGAGRAAASRKEAEVRS
jgi:transcriptional regulator with XRE-family HTH domain